MKTILVDDEKIMLRHLEMELKDNPKVELVGSFTLSTGALAYAQEHLVEFALLDIEMPTMNGIELGKKLRQINPDMVLIYVTGYSEYVGKAILEVKSDYYLLKPYTSETILEAVDRASLLSVRQRKQVYIHTFGRFSLFVNGDAVPFANVKAKELLALCVDHFGGEVTMEECVDKLWSNRPYDERVKNLYRKSVSFLKKTLSEAGCEKIFISERGKCRIKTDEIDCDYFRLFLAGWDEELESRFDGEYMIDYDWARETEAALIRGRRAYKNGKSDR